MKNNHPIVLKAANPLVVELDSEAHAAYVRFSKKRSRERSPSPRMGLTEAKKAIASLATHAKLPA